MTSPTRRPPQPGLPLPFVLVIARCCASPSRWPVATGGSVTAIPRPGPPHEASDALADHGLVASPAGCGHGRRHAATRRRSHARQLQPGPGRWRRRINGAGAGAHHRQPGAHHHRRRLEGRHRLCRDRSTSSTRSRSPCACGSTPTPSGRTARPITTKDMTAFRRAMSGDVKRLEVASTDGFDDIDSVDRGDDRFEYTVTFDIAALRLAAVHLPPPAGRRLDQAQGVQPRASAPRPFRPTDRSS